MGRGSWIIAGVVAGFVPIQVASGVDLTLPAELLAGAQNTIQFSNATPNTNILLFVTGAGEGPGPCPPPLAGACMGIRSPTNFGSAVTNVNGDAALTRNFSSQFADRQISFQAVDTAALTLSTPITQVVLPDLDQDGLGGGGLDCDDDDPNSTSVLDDADCDGLTDAEEALLGTDPLLVDTDGCGASDFAETQIDGTDPLSPAGMCDDILPDCAYPLVDLDDPGHVPPPDTFDPAWFSMGWQGAIDEGTYNDFAFDFNDDGDFTSDEELGAAIFFDFYGPERFLLSVDGIIFDDFLCTVGFNIDTATPVAAPVWDAAPATLFETFALNPGDGFTDCPALDPVVYGTDDVRELIANVPVEFALGELDFIADIAELQFADGVWDTDVEPFAYGAWASWDGGLTSAPIGYATIDMAVCGEIPFDFESLPAVSGAPLPNGVAASFDVFYFPVSALTGITCERPVDDIGVVGWTPPGGQQPMNIGLYTVELEGSVTPENEFGDYARDADADFVLDGVIEPYSARAKFQIYTPVPGQMAGPQFLCEVTFDASDTVAVDPGPWNLVDVLRVDLEQYGGFLWAAYETEISDGFSTDCGPIDPNVWGTDNIVDLLLTRTGGTVGFGYGPMFLLDANGPTVFQALGLQYGDFAPFLQGTYVVPEGNDAVEMTYSWLVDTDDCATETADGFLLPTAIAPAVPAANYEDVIGPWPVFFAGIPEPGFAF